ncbi:hypothetical protein F4776DRAFT_617889 [Hypoxylon sp. NC0597]|nr:hypothetical protein F4776DRAFT_617889 [Hypoxylon sp. NC0597]
MHTISYRLLNTAVYFEMYSRDRTTGAVLRFYQEVIRHPYLNCNVLIVPPPNGWNSINIQRKNQTVLDLLRHLPYLRPEKQYERLLVHWETIPICYCDNKNDWEIYPLPAYCVYLTHSLDREGTSLILDTNEGTIIEFSHIGSHITVPYEEYEALPDADKWKAHRTSPIAEFLDSWTRRYEKLVWMIVPNPISQPTTGRFYSRAETSAEEEELVRQEKLTPWHFQDDISHHGDENESELDREQRRTRVRERKHVAVGWTARTHYGG